MGGRPPGRSDAQAWAVLVTELLDHRGLTAESAAQPKGPVPASAVTIRRWRKGSQGVTADMVVDFCRALGYSAVDGLVRVGYMTQQEADEGRAFFASDEGREWLRAQRLTPTDPQ